MTWCNGYHGPTIGIAWTLDFETFHQLDNAFLPFNRNGVLFPRRVGGQYLMLSRPSDSGHTPFGDIYLSESPDLVHWGRHRHVLAPDPLDVAVHQGRRRTSADRDDRGLAAHLPRGADVLQRLRVFDGRRPARPRRALEGARPRARLPPLAPGVVRAGRRRAQCRVSLCDARRRGCRPGVDLLRCGRHGRPALRTRTFPSWWRSPGATEAATNAVPIGRRTHTRALAPRPPGGPVGAPRQIAPEAARTARACASRPSRSP